MRLDKYPTRQEYDYRDITSSRNIKFLITSPHGVYYLGLYGFLACNYSVMAIIKTSCPKDCSGHGSCSSNGVCSCRYGSPSAHFFPFRVLFSLFTSCSFSLMLSFFSPGFVGSDCSESVTLLHNGDNITSNVLAREWKYYEFDNSMNNTIVTHLTQLNVGEDCDLYGKYEGIPTLSSFDFRDTSTTKESELIIQGAKKGRYYIGVYGFSSSSTFALSLRSFSECPNQCSGATHGLCSSETYNCTCYGGYSGNSSNMITEYYSFHDTL